MTEEQKSKHREYQRRWRAEHPEKVREYARKWQAANPENVREYQRKYRKKYREEHREEINAYFRDWSKKNREKCNERRKSWTKRNPEAEREIHRRWRARRRVRDLVDLHPEMRDQFRPELWDKLALECNKELMLVALCIAYENAVNCTWALAWRVAEQLELTMVRWYNRSQVEKMMVELSEKGIITCRYEGKELMALVSPYLWIDEAIC